MRVYVDFDDCLCETARALAGLARARFGRDVPYDRIRAFDLKAVFGLSDVEMEEFRRLSHSDAALASYPPVAGAADALRALRAAGHEVDIVTGRPPMAHAGTSRWLAAAGLADFPVTYVDKYGRAGDYPVRPGDPPAHTMDALRARGYGAAVDDAPPALDALARWGGTRVFVFDRPWNRDYRLAPNMTRLASWSALRIDGPGSREARRMP